MKALGNFCADVKARMDQYCSAASNYVQGTRPYQALVRVSAKIQGTRQYQALVEASTKVLDVVLPRNEMTNRREFRFIPVCVENALGAACYDGLCPTAKVCEDKQLNATVQSVFDALVAECPRKNMQWEVRVMQDDDTVNAFCLPGGKTVITTGMINKLKENYEFDHEFTNLTFEDNIAAVMGHEIVHAAAGHRARQMQLNMLLFVVGKVASFVLPFMMIKKKPAEKPPVTLEERRNERAEERDVENKRRSLGFVIDLLFKLGSFLFKQHHSQCHELESDRFGIQLAYKADFNVKASVRLQHIFMDMQGQKDGDETGLLAKSLSVLSSHPASQKRLDANKQTIDNIKEMGIVEAFA